MYDQIEWYSGSRRPWTNGFFNVTVKENSACTSCNYLQWYAQSFRCRLSKCFINQLLHIPGDIFYVRTWLYRQFRTSVEKEGQPTDPFLPWDLPWSGLPIPFRKNNEKGVMSGTLLGEWIFTTLRQYETCSWMAWRSVSLRPLPLWMKCTVQGSIYLNTRPIVKVRI